MKAIHVNALDNVATALTPLHKGEKVLGITLLQDILQGHKFATELIPKGTPVIKYASRIGIATTDIHVGEWAHVHNIAGERGRGDLGKKAKINEQRIHTTAKIIKNNKEYKLSGYRRDDGSFGLRNHILIMPSVHCANNVVQRIANEIIYTDSSGNKNSKTIYITHQHGCSELSYDVAQTESVLVGSGANPNVYGVLVIGLGCEGVQAKKVAEKIKERAPYKEVHCLVIQENNGVQATIDAGIKIVKSMLEKARQIPKSNGTLDDLILGTECGGSDSFSGLSANPSLGAACDIVIGHGGSVILAETTELIGAEHLLATRAINETVKKQIYYTINNYEDSVIKAHADIRGANPSPGNIEGGLSSIEEKSLGCIYKAGNQPIVAVKGYAAPIVDKGLTFMNTPGNDIEQLSGMVAGGCNVCVFTTGRGTPTGSPITPTIKLSSNTDIFNSMHDAIDLNAGEILDGEKTPADIGEAILNFIVDISNDQQTKAELNQQNDFSIWRLATTV